jgi:hypothetical protein
MAFAFSIGGMCSAAAGRVLTAPAPNVTLFGVLLCLPTAPALPPGENGDFGTSPIYGQLSDKPLLAFVRLHGVRNIKHNRDETLNAEQRRAAPRAGDIRKSFNGARRA